MDTASYRPRLAVGALHGALIRGPVKPNGTWDLWTSFPSNQGRIDGQIAISRDHGETWSVAKVIPGSFAYSTLQVSPDKSKLLCLYESDDYRTQTLLSLPLQELARQ